MKRNIAKQLLNTLFYILLSVALPVACDDGEEFSSSPSLQLEFSCDTLSFDTLFTSIGSSTRMMKAYNRSGSGLRITSVTLQSGGSSGFRINVDGQYAQHLTDLEVRDGDSLYIFVEATLDKNGEHFPFVMCDNICFTLESGVQQYVTLLAYGRNVQFMHGRVVDSDTILPAGHYVVYDSLVVAEGVELSLSAGCRLYFHDNVGLQVYGRLNAEGAPGNPVVFRGDRTDNMFDYLPYDNIPGQWSGITFASSSSDNIMKYCDVHSADYGIKIEKGDTIMQRLTIDASRIENFYGNAFECVQSRVDVTNSLLANAQGNCVKIVGGSVRFIHCTIANFFVWKQRDVALALHNSIDGVVAPLHEALFANCIITGSKSDELMGYLSNWGDTIENCMNYRFVSSLINTIPDDNDNFVDIVYDDADVSPFAKEHFRLVDNSVFRYDFHLSDSSSARGMACEEYSRLLPYDCDGVVRESSLADAGCFQYVPEVDKESLQ